MIKPSNYLYCYHVDGTGNTIAMTNENQYITHKYAYSPFGILLKRYGGSQPFQYVGQYGVMAEQYDRDLYYMKARYYDADTGRFISEDPIGFDGGDVNL